MSLVPSILRLDAEHVDKTVQCSIIYLNEREERAEKKDEQRDHENDVYLLYGLGPPPYLP